MGLNLSGGAAFGAFVGVDGGVADGHEEPCSWICGGFPLGCESDEGFLHEVVGE